MPPLGFFTLLLLIVGGLNWGLIPIADKNVIADIVDSKSTLDVIYIAIGVAALLSLPALGRTR